MPLYLHRIMRPGTVHAVVTPEPSICRGGHFYATSTIRDTIYGIFHTFSAYTYITNAVHKAASEKLLSRMLIFIYHHLPRDANEGESQLPSFLSCSET